MQGHRSAPDPPPGQSKLPRHPVENIGFGQNTGEILPNFRQKSKEEFKARRVKRSFVPDIRQVSDTHRAWPEFQRGNWVGSCHNRHAYYYIEREFYS
ncbi:F-box family protein with DUF295 [Prunus dulcis]|uniref:F-box family protein with DUF295 n=1 Tax=Prunus dulcis TaxID=3755 RepID=A0A4Y1RJK6_PRUDU|nr:F-box family protein with DUF295 [Prunus dulcis]